MSQEFTMLVHSSQPRAADRHARVVFTVGGPLVYQPQSDHFGLLSWSMNSDEAEQRERYRSVIALAQAKPIHENEE
jgi:hypothetical protein